MSERDTQLRERLEAIAGDLSLGLMRTPEQAEEAVNALMEAAVRLARLEEMEREVNEPSGLREQLVAARKGEQIELRLRKAVERELRQLRERVQVTRDWASTAYRVPEATSEKGWFCAVLAIITGDLDAALVASVSAAAPPNKETP